jgi:hypothetical protein
MAVGSFKDAVFTVSHKLFMFSNHELHKEHILCTDSCYSSFNAGTVTLVEQHPGCMAKSNTHAAMGLKDISQTVPSVIAMWPEDLAKSLQDIDLTYRTSAGSTA